VCAQVTALIWPQPDQSVAELARAVGLTSAQLRSQLRQLAEEG
jgi:transposase-like protein